MANTAHLQEADIEKIYLCPLFRGLAPAKLATIIKKTYVKLSTYDEGAIIHKSGAKVSQVGLVLSGTVTTNGNDTAFPGDLFGEEYLLTNENRAISDYVAAEDTRILFLDNAKLQKDAESKDAAEIIANNLLAATVAKVHALQAHVSHLSKRNTREKLLAYLRDRAAAAGSKSFEVSLDRQELADYLAIERSAMCAELSKMQSDKLITYRKRDFTIR